MEPLSIALKILTALGVIVGFANLILGLRGNDLGSLSPRQLKLIGGALLALAVVLGVADHLTGTKPTDSPKPTDKEDGVHIGTINAPGGGDIVVGNKGPVTITRQTVEKLEIHPGDSPEEKARKRAQARRIVAQDIVVHLHHLDERLAALDSLQRPDETGDRLDQIRRKVAPSLQQSAGEGYSKLMADQKAAALEQAFTSAPLQTDQGEALARLLLETESDPAPIRRFNEALLQVEDASDKLVETVRAPASRPSVSSEEMRQESDALQTESLRLAIDTLVDKAQVAHIHGLVALDALDQDRAAIEAELSTLRHLSPRHLIDAADAQALLSEQASSEAERAGRRLEHLKQQQAALDRDLARYSELDQQLEINPDDPWNVVVGKARALRQLGKIGEAVAAFARYGEMFKSDPVSELYSRTAQAFTIQAGNLGLEGGVYLFELEPDSGLARAGLRTGDIIVGYAGRPSSDLVELTDTLASVPFGRSVQVDFLRFEQGGFERRRVTVRHGQLGAGLMPI